MKPLPSALGALAISVAISVLVGVAPPPEVGAAVVSSDHREASEAGALVLRKGGNAVDAAVAAALAAGVVQPAGSGLGGGGFAVVVTPDGRQDALDFREIAPKASTEAMYQGEEAKKAKASRVGALAVAVPGESRGLAALLKSHGKLPVAEVAKPAIALAAGFEVVPHLSKALSRTEYPQIQKMFTFGSGVATDGNRVRRPALAKTLKRWVSSVGEDLHTGRGAASVARTVQQGGGILTQADLADYKPKERTPVAATYKGYTLVTMPPPSSGGVVLLQSLRVLEGYDLKALGHNSSDYVHLVSEALKHAYADRAHHMGDPDFVSVPVERLISDERVTEVRQAIWPGRTFAPDHYGPLIAPPQDAGTQHIAVIDESGLAVALTSTINTSFGSGVVDEASGLILNNEMDDFVAAPGVPNAYGLVGNEANAIEAGKRPLSSMTPTVVLDEDGRVVLSIGASGGSFIISSVLQSFLNVVEFGLDPQEAVAAPRFHHQWQPDTLFLEPGFPVDVHRGLSARGHTITERDGFSSVQMVQAPEGLPMVGGADPRKGGWPARR